MPSVDVPGARRRKRGGNDRHDFGFRLRTCPFAQETGASQCCAISIPPCTSPPIMVCVNLFEDEFGGDPATILYGYDPFG
jgi:hypothetical protein